MALIFIISFLNKTCSLFIQKANFFKDDYSSNISVKKFLVKITN